jgi:ankyrin repeat protein
MSDQSSREQSSGPSVALGGTLLFFNVAAIVFSAAMLGWALQELRSEGERWGLVVVLLFAGSGMLVQFLLLAMTIWLVCSARRLARWIRLAAMLAIIVAVLLDGAALGCVAYSPYQHKQTFVQQNALYQSGLREAVLARDVARAARSLDQDPAAVRENDFEGNSALLLAVRGADQPMVEMLLQRGADPNSGHWDGTTPLHLAADRNAVEIARLLLDKGARVNEEDHSGKTALNRAKAAGSQGVIDLVVSRNGTDVDYGSRLVKAVEDGNAQLVTKLLDQGLKVDTSVPNGHCLLDYAAEKDNVEIAKLLIARGASVKRADKYGRTALHWASGEGNAKMVGFLIDQGAEIDAKEHEGMTPLHEAIYWSQWHDAKSLGIIQVLVEKGTDVNAKKNDGVTPLTYAKTYGTDPIRAFLRDHGAAE